MYSDFSQYLINNKDLRKYIVSLDNLFEEVGKIGNEEIQGNYAKYLCVLVSGSVEVFLKTHIMLYINSRTPEEVRKYIHSNIKNYTNLKKNKFVEIITQFSTKWGDCLKNSIDEELFASLDSIVNNRHLVAHGNFSQCTMSFFEVKRHYDNIKKLMYAVSEIIV